MLSAPAGGHHRVGLRPAADAFAIQFGSVGENGQPTHRGGLQIIGGEQIPEAAPHERDRRPGHRHIPWVHGKPRLPLGPANHLEPAGLLALMLLDHARRAARTAPDGSLVPLADQDRSRWDTAAIAEGIGILRGAVARDRLGEYQPRPPSPPCTPTPPTHGARTPERVRIPCRRRGGPAQSPRESARDIALLDVVRFGVGWLAVGETRPVAAPCSPPWLRSRRTRTGS